MPVRLMLERLQYVIEGGVGVKQSGSHTSISDHVLGSSPLLSRPKCTLRAIISLVTSPSSALYGLLTSNVG